LKLNTSAVVSSPVVFLMRARRLTRFLLFPVISVGLLATSGCGSSTTTVTAPSTISRCGVTLGASDATIPADGGTGRITVTTARECAWSAAPEVGWLSIMGPNSGQGDGSVEYRVTPNSDPAVRRGGIVLNDKRAEITQSAATCVIRLRQPSAGFSQSGGSGTIDVLSTSQLCTWSVTVSEPWITITSGANGKGSATVSYIVAATSGPPRTATITIAEQRFSVTQAEGCSYSITPQELTVNAAGGSGSITVATAAGCPWNSLSNESWIEVVQGASSSGSGSMRFIVDRTTGPARIGTLVIAGQAFTVTQTTGCSYQVAPTVHPAPATGGTFTVDVTTSTGCGWSASSNDSWISVLGSASGNGGGTVMFAVAAANGPAKVGTVAIGDQTVTVNQGPGCTYAISPESQTVAAAGGPGTVNVTTETGCAWSATSHADWISIVGNSTGSGNGTLNFTVAALVGSTRTGTMTIAGRTFTVQQADGCTLTLVPETANAPEQGASRSFNVQTGAGCGWTAASNAPWITISAPASGTGNGTVQLQIASHSGEQRNGTVTVSSSTPTIASKIFAVHQDGGCSIAFSPTSVTIPAGGAPGSFNVSTDATCDWTPRTDDDWITISSPGKRFGNGTVTFTVAPNTGPARSGAIRAAGRTFEVNQEGSCTFSITPTSQNVSPVGGEVVVNVTGPAGCTWSTVSNATWITVVGSGTGSGNGSVQLGVSGNQDSARTGTATIAGIKCTVEQASGCTYGVAPAAHPIPAAGGAGIFNVTTSGPTCQWTAVADVSWITITGNASGTGPGAVNFSVQANSGAARSGKITVQGQVVTINQSGV
jgi:hypothetical protein